MYIMIYQVNKADLKKKHNNRSNQTKPNNQILLKGIQSSSVELVEPANDVVEKVERWLIL